MEHRNPSIHLEEYDRLKQSEKRHNRLSGLIGGSFVTMGSMNALIFKTEADPKLTMTPMIAALGILAINRVATARIEHDECDALGKAVFAYSQTDR